MSRRVLFLLAILSSGVYGQQQPAPTQRIAYIKDKKVSVVLHESDLIVSGLDGKDRKLISELAFFPTWSPDGKRLAYFGQASAATWREMPQLGVMLYDFTSRKSTMLLDVKSMGPAQAAAWSPDGKQLAFAIVDKHKSRLVMIDVATGKTQTVNFSGGIECASDPNWAPDGKSLVVYECAKDKRGLALIDPGGRLLRRLTEPEAGGFDRFPVWSPDGLAVAFVSSRGDAGKPDPERRRRVSVYLIKADGTGLRVLVTHNELSMLFPSWSSDGKLLAVEAMKHGVYFQQSDFKSIGSKVIVLNMADGHVLTTLGDNTEQPALAPMPK